MNVPCSRVHSGVIAVGLTAVQLPSNPDAKWIQFMHSDATAKVYMGGSDVTIVNGYGALGNLDTTERYPVFNTNIIYLISDTAATDVRYFWGE